MTGFGSASASSSARIISVDLKALNSKQLDLIIKLPTRYRKLEGILRNLITDSVGRGKIEVVVSSEITGSESINLLNIPLLMQYKEQISRMDRELGIEAPEDWHNVLLRLPDVLKGEETGLDDEETEAFMEATREALKNMQQFRKDEGARLEEMFVEKIANIRRLLGEVAPHEEGRVAKIKTRLYEQLEKLNGVEIDNGRLEQELIYYIEKLDISEEKQRLNTHLDYFLSTMAGDGEDGGAAKGKKLGFIAQEMGREINTLGSKSNNAEMQILVVKMKDELEQIKEQVLNVL